MILDSRCEMTTVWLCGWGIFLFNPTPISDLHRSSPPIFFSYNYMIYVSKCNDIFHHWIWIKADCKVKATLCLVPWYDCTQAVAKYADWCHFNIQGISKNAELGTFSFAIYQKNREEGTEWFMQWIEIPVKYLILLFSQYRVSQKKQHLETSDCCFMGEIIC